MKKKKAIRKAYRRGRKEGFDKGFNTARMIFEAVTADAVGKAVDLKLQIEEMNSEFILGDEEEEVEDD